MRISEIARQADVGVEAVRFYERKGLIARPPRPAGGGYRDYPVHVADRISFVRRAQQLGFSLTEIAELLALKAGDDTRCVDVRRRAERKRAEVQDNGRHDSSGDDGRCRLTGKRWSMPGSGSRSTGIVLPLWVNCGR